MSAACRRLLVVCELVAVLALHAGAVWADEFTCGSLYIGAYGEHPLDYRNPPAQLLHVVEQYHFTPDVESLRKPKSSTTVSGDLDYTLRAVPNHHRALVSMMNLALRERTNKPEQSSFTMECWFERATRFVPDDATVYMLWGIYRARTGDKKGALEFLEKADSLGESGSNFQYNLGLVFADLGKYDKAMEHAAQAYAAGFDLPGLKRKLESAGAWKPELVEKAKHDADAAAAPSEATASAPVATP